MKREGSVQFSSFYLLVQNSSFLAEQYSFFCKMGYHNIEANCPEPSLKSSFSSSSDSHKGFIEFALSEVFDKVIFEPKRKIIYGS
jgi:hypothetical protein